MKMETELSVLTLNCWGIPGISKNRSERFAAITSIVSEGNYDFVFLQEVWDKDDYEAIKMKAASVMPYSHYFYGGVIGSGVCVFSKGRVVDIGLLRFSLNGYFHKFHHGDWFGGKVVGLCKVQYKGLNINLYNTHFHAEYCPDNDEYLAHRVMQAWELSQYINLTCAGSDLCILAGDLNTKSDDIPCKVVRYNANLYDSFSVKENKDEDSFVGASCGHPRNSYTSSNDLKHWPNGQRIDYIMYGFHDGSNVRCLQCKTPYDKIGNKTVSYSDHEAVACKLLVKKSDQALGYTADQTTRLESLRYAKLLLQTGMNQLKYHRAFYVLMAIICLILLIISGTFYVPYPFNLILVPLRVFLTVLIAFAIFMAVVINRMENHNLLSAMVGIEVTVSDIVEVLGLRRNSEND